MTRPHDPMPAGAAGGPSSAAPPAPRTRRWRPVLLCLACLVLTAGVFLGYRSWSSGSGLDRARAAARTGDWDSVRTRLKGYIRWHPHDSAARLLMAEALVKADSGDTPEAVEQALHHLQQVDVHSPLAAQARLQEGRLSLLILQQPSRAERLLQESLGLDPDLYDANLLMWKLLDLTGRHNLSGDYFWQVYELSHPDERPQRLRDWFLAEFYPESANEPFHRALGARAVSRTPASVSLLVRLRESDPAAACLHAALATYYLDHDTPQAALELLNETPDLATALDDPFFVSVLFEVLVQLGELQKAEDCFLRFPAPHSGYYYWRAEGVFRQYIRNDADAAAQSYEQALTTWPARFDWGMMTQLAECLRKSGRHDEAEETLSRVQHLTSNVLTNENIARLRERLRDLNDPEVAADLRDLYQELGLEREAQAWNAHRLSLAGSGPVAN